MDNSKPLEHWRDPRGTIACRHKANDFAYALHGAQMAAYVLRYLDLRPSELRGMTCLDYGCGTGRIARVLASHFGQVYAYDPQSACMEEAAKECPEIPIPNLALVRQPVPADVAVSVNVLEHLDDERAEFALSTMLQMSPVAVVWYHARQNHAVMRKYLPDLPAHVGEKQIHIAVIRR